MKQYDVAAMGELLIDLTQNGYSDQGNPIFEANPVELRAMFLPCCINLEETRYFLGK